MSVLNSQYDLIRQTRERLFLYCERISPEDYVKELEQVGWGSIRNLHAHIAGCYQAWLGRYALEWDAPVVKGEEIAGLPEMKALFKEVDALVETFLKTFGDRPGELLRRPLPGHEVPEVLSVLWLFTQTITHEFHHKGQIVQIGRQLGYVPIDTDLITPDDMVRL
ncbi:MAG TPA: DinB family protein [Bacillales bacterium]|nr:DinB family protein [Bacillales bacterium]